MKVYCFYNDAHDEFYEICIARRRVEGNDTEEAQYGDWEYDIETTFVCVKCDKKAGLE